MFGRPTANASSTTSSAGAQQVLGWMQESDTLDEPDSLDAGRCRTET